MVAVSRFFILAALLAAWDMAAPHAGAEEKISIADGKLSLAAPEGWQRKQPSSGIVEHEFLIPKAEGDPADGRMTVMGAGGSVDANIERWLGQFLDADGEKVSKEKVRLDKKQIAGEDVVIVDLRGTYLDKPGGPFAPGKTVQRKNYRMLAGIITTKKSGNYFFKFYGPEKTVDANEKAFLSMLDTLEKK